MKNFAEISKKRFKARKPSVAQKLLNAFEALGRRFESYPSNSILAFLYYPLGDLWVNIFYSLLHFAAWLARFNKSYLKMSKPYFFDSYFIKINFTFFF